MDFHERHERSSLKGSPRAPMRQDSWDRVAVTANRKHTLIAATLLCANDDLIGVNIRQLPVHRLAYWATNHGSADTVGHLRNTGPPNAQSNKEDRYSFTGR